MDLIDVIDRTRFLGPEFLLWIWFSSRDQPLRVGLDDGEVMIEFADLLTLSDGLAQTESACLRGGCPADSPEALAALAGCKRVASARIYFETPGGYAFEATSNANLDLSQVRRPSVLAEDDDDALVEDLRLLERLDKAWEAAYAAFLTQRLSDAWDNTQQELIAWMRHGDLAARMTQAAERGSLYVDGQTVRVDDLSVRQQGVFIRRERGHDG